MGSATEPTDRREPQKVFKKVTQLKIRVNNSLTRLVIGNKKKGFL
jgi:hypothetical protein